MMDIHKAVIPVAGLGTRLLPATKSQPKEMLPVGRKPIVQYVVEELEHSGLRHILFVTGRGKRSIEDHFDADVALYRSLEDAGRTDLLEQLRFEEMAANFFYVRQGRPKGLGHAVLQARDFIGDEYFVVALGDTIITGNHDDMLLKKMCAVQRERDAAAVVAVEQVATEDIHRYGVIDPAQGVGTGVLELKGLVEKPSPDEAPSDLAIASRYVLSPDIFPAIEHTLPDRKGELQLTDAIASLIKQGKKVCAVVLSGEQKRYDVGNFPSYYRAFIDFALRDDEYGYMLRQYLIKVLEEE